MLEPPVRAVMSDLINGPGLHARILTCRAARSRAQAFVAGLTRRQNRAQCAILPWSGLADCAVAYPCLAL